MYYIIDTDRRRIIGWWKTLDELKLFMYEHDIALSGHVKIVKEIE